MSLHLTPDMLEAEYILLCLTLPFRRWKLPHPDVIEFRVSSRLTVDNGRRFEAEFRVVQGAPIITVSAKNVKTLHQLSETMAHEMCHLREELHYGASGHGTRFKRFAAQVCKHHGFNEGTF